MRIVYMGTPDFAVAPLKAIYEAGHELLAVVTQPDKPNSRRGKEIIFSPVKQTALGMNLPIIQPSKASDSEFIAYLRSLNADMFVVCAYGQLLGIEILNMTKYGCVNIHASLLPKYRGAAPIHRAIMNGETETGVTLMYMDKGLDTGDMMIAEAICIEQNDTAGILFDRLSIVGSSLIIKGITLLSEGCAPRIPQDETLSSYAQKIKKNECRIDFTEDAKSVHDRIRGLNPFPTAYTTFNEKIIKLYDSKLLSECYNSDAGTLVKTVGQGIVVACGHGSVLIETLKPEGKRFMEASEFWAGLQNKNNAIFGK
ncbi:MAG: methionyl-tRNA formyltransferase [Anaerofustis sp.]